jgi:CHAT domain-containing protein
MQNGGVFPPNMASARSGKSFWLLATAIAVVMVLFIVSDAFRALLESQVREMMYERRVRPLIEAAQGDRFRTTEARVVAFPYKPLRRELRSKALRRDVAMLAAATKVGRDDARSTNELHALALAHLSLDDDETAAKTFERALATETRSATIYESIRRGQDSTLLANAAAAFYTTAARRQFDSYFGYALVSADRALGLDPRNSAALFTRALILEKLELWDDAREAWQRVIDGDPDSPWATEAKDHIDARPAPRKTADVLSARIDSALRSKPSPEMASAIQTYARAIANYKNLEIDKAEAGCDAAIAVFERAQSPMRFAASVQKAGCRFYRNDFRGALAIARRALASISGDDHGTRGRLLWVAGLCQIVLGEPRASLASYHAALAEMIATGDADSVSAIENLLAEAYQYLGDTETAVLHRRAALDNAYSSGSAFRISMALSEAGSAALERGETEVAKVIFARFVKTSKKMNNPMVAVDALMCYARLLPAGSARSAAFRDALILARKSNRDIRDRLCATVALREAETERTSDQRLDAAIEFFAKSNSAFSLADALLVRGRLLSVRDPTAAERDFRRGLSVINAELENIADPISRARYLERRQDFFDEIVPLLRNDHAAAFRVADEAHHALLATYRNANKGSREIAASEVPHGTAIIEYFVAGLNIFWWTLGEGALRSGVLSMPAEEIRKQTKSLEQAIAEDRTADARVLLRDFDEQLLRPALAHVGPVSHLVVIPDRFLFRLPFAAFIGADHRHRIASMSIGTDISALHYLDGLRRDAQRRPSNDVGIIAIAQATGHVALPQVVRETDELRRIYGTRAVYAQPHDSVAFIRMLGTHTIAHIASHGFADARTPLHSGLRLGHTGTVTAYELALARFPSTRLVFLGACGSNAAIDKRTAVGNVSTAFLAAGVPAVIGVLWDIEDHDARELAVAFHTALRAGNTPHAALRQAQLRFLQRNPSLAWSGYTMLGASTINEREEP